VAHMVVAASRAVLDLWCAGALSREAAVRDTVRGVSALLAAFTVADGRPTPRRRARPGAQSSTTFRA